jgi:hypothetical protein
VVLWVNANVTEKHAVSILRAESRMFLRNVGIDLQNHTVPKPKTTPTLSEKEVINSG